MATIPIFDGTNYEFWSVKMKTLFLSMDFWDTVQNGYDETSKEKQQKDAAALSHIQQGVSDRIFPRIKNATKAKQAWDILSQYRIPIFDGINYDDWNAEMRDRFASMDLWRTVQNGYNDEPSEEAKQKDAAALSDIQQGVSDRIFPIIKDATTAKQAWDILSQLSTVEKIPIFDGNNYESWSVKMRNLFLSEELWDTVQDGYNQQDEADRGNQQQRDAAALSHIQKFVSPRVCGRIKDATTAKQAWDILFRFGTQDIIPIDLRQTGANHLIVATLVATVAFTAGFTMPGGYNSNDGPNQGMAILTRETAFKAFMVTDAMAVSFSFSAVLIHFHVAMIKNGDEVMTLVGLAAYLLIGAAIAMVLAFVTGTYAVLAHSSGLAISVCVIGCLSLFVLGNVITMEKVVQFIFIRKRH